jgi:hypothetical protein
MVEELVGANGALWIWKGRGRTRLVFHGNVFCVLTTAMLARFL